MRPTREEFTNEWDRCIDSIPYDPTNYTNLGEAMRYITREAIVHIYKKYLSDQNSVESTETKSE